MCASFPDLPGQTTILSRLRVLEPILPKAAQSDLGLRKSRMRALALPQVRHHRRGYPHQEEGSQHHPLRNHCPASYPSSSTVDPRSNSIPKMLRKGHHHQGLSQTQCITPLPAHLPRPAHKGLPHQVHTSTSLLHQFYLYLWMGMKKTTRLRPDASWRGIHRPTHLMSRVLAHHRSHSPRPPSPNQSGVNLDYRRLLFLHSTAGQAQRHKALIGDQLLPPHSCTRHHRFSAPLVQHHLSFRTHRSRLHPRTQT